MNDILPHLVHETFWNTFLSKLSDSKKNYSNNSYTHVWLKKWLQIMTYHWRFMITRGCNASFITFMHAWRTMLFCRGDIGIPSSTMSRLSPVVSHVYDGEEPWPNRGKGWERQRGSCKLERTKIPMKPRELFCPHVRKIATFCVRCVFRENPSHTSRGKMEFDQKGYHIYQYLFNH